MSNLPSGKYRITTAIKDGTDVGRGKFEDFSLNPKAIVCCDASWGAQSWDIQPTEAGKYVLKAHRNATGIFNDDVVAYLLDVAPVEWYITPAKTVDPDMYIISNSDDKAWDLSDTEVGTKVACKDLIHGMSPKNQVWSIVPLIEDN